MSELHVVSVVLTLLIVVYSDEQALMWLLGRKQMLSKKRVDLLHILVSLGLGGILLTGGVMFIDRADYLLSQPVFIVKMIFVGALVINAFFIGAISDIACNKPFASLTTSERWRVFMSGAISILGWGGALICGLLLGD